MTDRSVSARETFDSKLMSWNDFRIGTTLYNKNVNINMDAGDLKY